MTPVPRTAPTYSAVPCSADNPDARTRCSPTTVSAMRPPCRPAPTVTSGRNDIKRTDPASTSVGPVKRHVVALAVTDGAPILELAVPCEVFGIDRSDLADPWYDFRLVAAETGGVRTAPGLLLEAAAGLDVLDVADTVLVGALPRARQVDPPAGLVSAVRRAHAEGRRVVGLCTGAYVLAAAGVLDGRRATTHWMNAVDFAYRHPRVRLDPDVLYVDDGDILT